MSSLQEHHRLRLRQTEPLSLLKGFCQIKTPPRWKLRINRRSLCRGGFVLASCRVTSTSPGFRAPFPEISMSRFCYFQSLNICRHCDRSLKVTSWHWTWLQAASAWHRNGGKLKCKRLTLLHNTPPPPPPPPLSLKKMYILFFSLLFKSLSLQTFRVS